MNKYLDIISVLEINDIMGAESMFELLRHQNEVKITFQTNYTDLWTKKTTEFFFKFYVLDGNKWEFFGYGWLKGTCFYTHKSKLLVFDIPDIDFKMMRRNDSSNHMIVSDNNNKFYLFYSPYYEIIDLWFDLIVKPMPSKRDQKSLKYGQKDKKSKTKPKIMRAKRS